MLEWWMKNCVAVIAMVLPATVVLLWLSPAIHATTLCKADDPCIREWASALSGWVAFLIAIPTLFSLRKQVVEASRQADEAAKTNINSARIQLRRNYTLAKRVESTAHFILMNSISLGNDVEKGAIAPAINPGESNVYFRIDLLIDMLEQGGFDQFEREIEFPTPYTAEFIRRRAGHLKDILKPLGDVAIDIGLRAEILDFADWCRSYAGFCDTAAKSFIEEADEMRGISHARASRIGT